MPMPSYLPESHGRVFGRSQHENMYYLFRSLYYFAKEFKRHLERLDIVLTRLMECNLKLSANECYFFKKQVKFVGHVVREDGIETDLDKVKNWPMPQTSHELRSFVAFCGYYRWFIKDFSKIAKPLTDLLPPIAAKKGKQKQQQWLGGPEQEETFNLLKDILYLPIQT